MHTDTEDHLPSKGDIMAAIDTIRGKSLAEAASIIAEVDYSFRVVKRDGVADYVPLKPRSDYRVNLEMIAGRVDAYHIG